MPVLWCFQSICLAVESTGRLGCYVLNLIMGWYMLLCLAWIVPDIELVQLVQDIFRLRCSFGVSTIPKCSASCQIQHEFPCHQWHGQTIYVVWKQVYFRLRKEGVSFPKSLEYHYNVFQMLLKWIWEYEYIIKMYMDEFSYKISESNGHKLLKCRWGITVTHLYDATLECSKDCGEHGFIHVFRLNKSLLISLSHVQLGPESSLHYVLTYSGSKNRSMFPDLNIIVL